MGNFFAAIAGAIVGGGFVVLAQWWQRQSERRAAGRALLIELMGNAKQALHAAKTMRDLMPVRAGERVAPDKSKLDLELVQRLLREAYSSRVWSEQLALLADRFDWPSLNYCLSAYADAAVYFQSVSVSPDILGVMADAFATLAERFAKACALLLTRPHNGCSLPLREMLQGIASNELVGGIEQQKFEADLRSVKKEIERLRGHMAEQATA